MRNLLARDVFGDAKHPVGCGKDNNHPWHTPLAHHHCNPYKRDQSFVVKEQKIMFGEKPELLLFAFSTILLVVFHQCINLPAASGSGGYFYIERMYFV